MDFSAYTAYIWNVKKHNITMRDTESVLIKRNPNKCGHKYLKHVYRKCVVYNTVEKNEHFKIGSLIIHVDNLIKHCFKLAKL